MLAVDVVFEIAGVRLPSLAVIRGSQMRRLLG